LLLGSGKQIRLRIDLMRDSGGQWPGLNFPVELRPAAILPLREEHSHMVDFPYYLLLARRSVLLASVFVASCCALWAQTDGPGGPPPGGPPPGEMQMQARGPNVERQLKQLTQLLTLSEEQQTRVKAILLDQRQQIEALFKQSKTGAEGDKASTDSAAAQPEPPSPEKMEALRAARKAIREDAHARIAALLTDDQKAKFAAWRQRRERSAAREESEEMPPRPPDGEGGPPPDGGGGPGGGPGGGGPPGV
jgi:Spy/CpxP family protein refolding chaperone